MSVRRSSRLPVSGLRHPPSSILDPRPSGLCLPPSSPLHPQSSILHPRPSAFTLIELLVVIAIIVVMTLLLVPAFTSIKGGQDVTSAAHVIKGVLEQARTHAMANNTYTWIGFYEEDTTKPVPSPTATPGTGRLVLSIVASKDGTTVYNPSSSLNPDPIDPTRLSQIGKLVRIDNIHLPLFAIGTGGTGDTFNSRPALQSDPFGVGYNASRFGELNAPAPITAPYDTTNNGNSKFPFQYPAGSPAPTAQYTFRKTLQFNPRGECRINSTYDVRRVIEIGLIQTHGNTVPAPVSGAGTSTAVYDGNVVAIQIAGFGGEVKIYRKK